MEEEFRGIILYDIQLNGDLNGVYTNNHSLTNGRMFTETARLRSNENDTTRVYDCFYFDVDDRVNCTLTFRITNTRIEAQWLSLENRVLFQGEGFQMNNNQIAISYWEAS